MVWLGTDGYRLNWESFDKADRVGDAGMNFSFLQYFYMFLNVKKDWKKLEHLGAFWVITIAVDWVTGD